MHKVYFKIFFFIHRSLFVIHIFMLYLFYGTDTEKARAKFLESLNSLRAKKQNASFVEIDDESFSISRAEELLHTRGMFENTVIVAFRTILKNEEAQDFLKKNAKSLAVSTNIFVVYEDEKRKTILSLLEKYADKVWRFDAKTPQKTSPIVFTLADNFASRDRKKAWLTLQKAISEGIAPEQIFGTLFWQMKNIAIVRRAKKDGSIEKLAMTPFMRGKSERLGKKFRDEELSHILSILIDKYHEREEGLDPELALEKLVLSN